MIIDTSAIVSIMFDEPGHERFVDAISQASVVRLSAASYVELGAVIDRRGTAVLSRQLDHLLAQLGVEIAPVDARQAQIARQAYRDYGRGSGHAAGLNFGDCFAYALAADLDDELLWKGDDFGHTDVRPALPDPPI